MRIDLISKGVTIPEKLEDDIYSTLYTHFGNVGYKDMVLQKYQKA